MRKIFVIAWKDTLLRFTSPWEWLFFLVLPIVFTLALAGGTGGSSDNRIRLDVVDQANSPLSAELLAALGDSTTVNPQVMPLAQAEDDFSSKRVSSLLVIPPAFDLAHLKQGSLALELRQQANNLNALAAAQAVSEAAGRISSLVDIASASTAEASRIRPFTSAAAQAAYFDQALQLAQAQMGQVPPRLSIVHGTTPEQIEYDPRANSSAGQLITWVFIPLLGISSMLAYERQKGTLRRLLTTPTSKATFLLGTIVGQFVIALLQMLLLVGFGILVMGLHWGHAPGALAVMMVTSVLAAAALGTALGTFVKTDSQANGLSIMLGMVMALLGGCWYPIELFPAFVQSAVKVLPTTWAMQGMLDIVLRGQGLAAVLPEAGVLLGFAALFFVIGVVRFRYE
jgi:ABC-2 type transport system permease protein